MSRVTIAALVCAFGLALAWAVADADEPLAITLSAPTPCEADFDGRPVTPTLEVEWRVSGGAGPYDVIVDGERYEGFNGVASVICGIWDTDEPDNVDSGVMTIQARATDASGDVATAVAYIYAVRVIRADDGYGTDRLRAGHTYQLHGVLLTIPDEFDVGVSSYVSGDCEAGQPACDDHFVLAGGMARSVSFSIAFSRWSGPELQRRVESLFEVYGPIPGGKPATEAEITAVHAALDRLTASVGEPPAAPPRAQGASEAGDLRIHLMAPAICETYWGPYGGRRQYVEVEWQVSGGDAPYRVQFAQQSFEMAQGVLRLPCGYERTDRWGVDAQLMTTQAIVTDSVGATASGIVNTYAIAAGRFGDDLLRGGWTHRMQGLLMTIPEGLEFNVSSIGGTEVDCMEGTCTHAGCLDSGIPICENSWTMWTTGGSVSATFGQVTKEMFTRHIDEAGIADDPGVGVDTAAEVERLLDELAASIGEPPQLPDDGVFNPAPLRIAAWADPVACTARSYEGEGRSTSAQRRVSGGYWWPLGIGDEVWNERKHRVTRLHCPAAWGWHSQVLEVHEGGPSPANAETTVTHFTPPERGDGVLLVQSWASPSTYCEFGSSRRVWFSVQGGAGPYRATLNGVDLEMDYDPLDPDNGDGDAMVACADTVGLQAVTLEVWDSSEPAHYTAHPIILSVVEEHPSGQPWSDFD